MKKITLFLAVFFCCTTFAQDWGSRSVTASSAGIILDSDVYQGGGTDQTAAIQAILDKAKEWGRLYFVMDGCALVSQTLRVHSNTTIFCPDRSCGFFLAAGSDCSVISNSDWSSIYTFGNRNITLIGGSYNNNSPGQVHHREANDRPSPTITAVFGMEWYGVENLTLRDLAIINQRTYACNFAGWKNVVMENIHIERIVRSDAQNQDGIHFYGPGQHLSMKNIYGNSGDDFIAVTPDELDLKSSISDVLIDGVWLDDADQAIRLLCRADGRLDRVTVRNVSGTYRSYGFFINPWYESTNGGHFGNIVLENIDLRPLKNNYTYFSPFLFKLGGNIESLTLRNIYHHHPQQGHHLAIIGGHYVQELPRDEVNPTHIDRLIVDGLYKDEDNPVSYQDAYIDVVGADIDLLSIDNVIIRRNPTPQKPSGSLVRISDGKISEILKGKISTPCLKSVVTDRQ